MWRWRGVLPYGRCMGWRLEGSSFLTLSGLLLPHCKYQLTNRGFKGIHARAS